MIRAGIDNLRDLPADRVDLDDFYSGSVDKNPVDKIYCKRGGFIPPFEFNPREFNFNMLQMEDTDANQTLSLLKVKEAMVDAGMDPSGDVKKNCGCILGIGGGQKASQPVLLAHELRDRDQGAPQHGHARGGRREGGREVQGALPRVAPRLVPGLPRQRDRRPLHQRVQPRRDELRRRRRVRVVARLGQDGDGGADDGRRPLDGRGRVLHRLLDRHVHGVLEDARLLDRRSR